MGRKLLSVRVVELVPMPVPPYTHLAAVAGGRTTRRVKVGSLGTQAHRATLIGDRLLFVQKADHCMGRVLAELGRMGTIEANDVPCELDRGTLHSQADAEERNAPLTGEADGFDFPLDAALAEAAGNDDAVESRQQPFGAFVFDLLALNRLHADLRAMRDPRVIERFVDRLVRITVLG